MPKNHPFQTHSNQLLCITVLSCGGKVHNRGGHGRFSRSVHRFFPGVSPVVLEVIAGSGRSIVSNPGSAGIPADDFTNSHPYAGKDASRSKASQNSGEKNG
jgi:hypothetical protein